MTAAVVLAVGGGLGAALRYTFVLLVPEPRSGFPVAITVVNVAGSLVLGFLVGAGFDGPGWIDVDVVGIGMLGGFTTFSTWMVDAHAQDSTKAGALVVFLPLILGMAAAFVGIAMGNQFG